MANEPKKDILRECLPGTGRVAMQLYTGREAGYRQPSGFSESHIKIKNQRELRRLWDALIKVIERREWTDDYIDRTERPGPVAVAVGQG